MKKIIVLIFLIAGNLQAHLFNVSSEISDNALRELSTFRNFGHDSSLAVYPMSHGKAIAIYVDNNPGWFTSSQAYYCCFYEGSHWGKPCKILDYNSAEKFYPFSCLKIRFVSNEKDEAYLAILDMSDKNNHKMQVCQLIKGDWTAPVTVSGKQFLMQIDLNGAALIKTENKIAHIKDQNIHTEELENTKYTSHLIRDNNGYLCYLTLVEDITTERSLIEEHAWDGFQWHRTPLAEVETASLNWLTLQVTPAGKFAFWRLQSPENITKSYCSISSPEEEWSSPELIDETNQSQTDSIRVCSLQDSILCVWHKDFQLVSKRWISGYWEDTRPIVESPNLIRWSMKKNSKGQAYVFWECLNRDNFFGNVSIWDKEAWSLPTKIFNTPSLNMDILKDNYVHDIDDRGNIFVAWEEKNLFSFFRDSRKIRYSTFSNNQWCTKEIEGIAGVPFLFNYKGTLVLAWLESDGKASRFSFYHNGELSESFNSKTPQIEINHYLNLSNP